VLHTLLKRGKYLQWKTKGESSVENFFRFIMVCIFILVMAGCEASVKEEPLGREHDFVEEQQTPQTETSQEAQPVQSEPEHVPEPEIPFDNYVEIPVNHYIEKIESVSDRELKVRVRDGSTYDTYYAGIDMDKKEFTKLEETEKGENQFEVVSPTGEWTLVWDRSTPGIWGVSTKTDEKKQWTKGTGDWSPVWNSDGTGFYYLHATGNSLGDGAGPEHTLARYDVASGKEEILNFERGYWGWIKWLEPDRSLIAFNGFDDVFAVKVVNLQEGIEKQIIGSTAHGYIDVAIHPTKPLLLASEHGKFNWFDDEGNEVSRSPWPFGLDDFTKKNAAYIEGENAYELPYYEVAVDGGLVGPHFFQFSPDGQHLAYLLGAIGQSIDDRIPGSKLVVSLGDSMKPDFVMEEYVRIIDYAWGPSSDRLFVAFNLDGHYDQVFVGEILIEKDFSETLHASLVQMNGDEPEFHYIIENQSSDEIILTFPTEQEFDYILWKKNAKGTMVYDYGGEKEFSESAHEKTIGPKEKLVYEIDLNSHETGTYILEAWFTSSETVPGQKYYADFHKNIEVTIDAEKEVAASTKHFKVYSPKDDEKINVDKGISFHAEIHESAIGNIQVELLEKDGTVLNRFEINQDNFFDDGVFAEWTFFALSMRFENEPKSSEGVLRISDQLSNETIELDLHFDK
jgi:hypothetical protein